MASQTVTLSIDRLPDRGSPVSKTCSTCKTPKPRDQFHRRTGRKDGLQPLCKACARIASFLRYHKGKGKEYAKEYRSRPEAMERARISRRSAPAAERERDRAYANTPMGKLVKGKSVTKARLKNPAMSDARRSQLVSRLAFIERDIERLKARRIAEVEMELKRSPGSRPGRSPVAP